MTYEKPEAVVSGQAIALIQAEMKKQGTPPDNTPVALNTISAYQADE